MYNIHVVNKELDAVNQWFYANKLCLNVKETKYILFRPFACFSNITNKHLYIDNKPISRVGDTEEEKSFKFLGIAYERNSNMETSHRKSLLKDLSFQLHNKQSQTHLT